MRIPSFVCPRCHGALERATESYRCIPCAAEYPVVLGIPDFRLFPDPWIGLEDDRTKARRLSELVRGRSFADAVRIYWEITPSTSRPLAERFTQHVVGAAARANDWLEWIDRAEGPASGGCWLDVGCGTADIVAAGAGRGLTIVGVDIALRWLVIAARRPELEHRGMQLVCANGEHLPFADESFVRVVSLGTLEHCRDADRVIADSKRVLRRGGLLRVRTVNRYSLLPEPHVGVWGVGLVPRRWADDYVRRVSDQRYQHHRPLSARELARGFHRAGLSDVQVGAAAVLAADRARLAGGMRWLVPLYERLREARIVGSMIRWVAPLLDARGVAP